MINTRYLQKSHTNGDEGTLAMSIALGRIKTQTIARW